MLRAAGIGVVVLFFTPLFFGLLGTVLPAFGLLLGAQLSDINSAGFSQLLADPCFLPAVLLFIKSGVIATVMVLALCFLSLICAYGTRAWHWFLSALPPLQAVPHVALAVGLIFLLSPELTGWQRPPIDWTVPDANAWALIIGLVGYIGGDISGFAKCVDTAGVCFGLVFATSLFLTEEQTLMSSLRVSDAQLHLLDGRPMFDPLSFTIELGQVMVLMGPSGCGKSSLLGWLTNTLDSAITASGEILLGDTPLASLPTEKRRLGLVLQQNYLFPHMTVEQNLLFGLRESTAKERKLRIQDSLLQAGLQGMEGRDPATLSGGQRARVGLLRTLLSSPQALLLDEPFSRLDIELRAQVRKFTWKTASALPTLLVTHDEADIPEHAVAVSLTRASYA